MVGNQSLSARPTTSGKGGNKVLKRPFRNNVHAHALSVILALCLASCSPKSVLQDSDGASYIVAIGEITRRGGSDTQVLVRDSFGIRLDVSNVFAGADYAVPTNPSWSVYYKEYEQTTNNAGAKQTLIALTFPETKCARIDEVRALLNMADWTRVQSNVRTSHSEPGYLYTDTYSSNVRSLVISYTTSGCVAKLTSRIHS
jgi:hypothetical protein